MKKARHGSNSARQAAGRGKPAARDRTPTSLLRQFETSRPAKSSPLAVSAVHDMPFDLVDRIRAFPLFTSAPDGFLVDVCSYLRPQLFATAETILYEGEEAKALYFLVRGTVAVMSRDGESTFAELKPGAFFGEIAILLDMPRTANVVARHKTLVLRLNKEDLGKILPQYPEIEKDLRDEAAERLMILTRLKREKAGGGAKVQEESMVSRGGKRTNEHLDRESDKTVPSPLTISRSRSAKKRKSPGPAVADASSNSALSSGTLHVRKTLKQLPLFQNLPDDVLHFLGLNAQPRHYPPFTNIVTQGLAGREVFFITSGHVEVFTQNPGPIHANQPVPSEPKIKARLGPGEYFGEVVSLSLASKRTATVRSIVQVECLTIPGEVLEDFWSRLPPALRQQVEETARQRLNQDPDVQMVDDGDNALAIGGLAIDESDHSAKVTKKTQQPSPAQSEPIDPDPFKYHDNVGHRRHRSSRASSVTNAPVETSPLAEGRGRRTSVDKNSPWSSAPPTRAGTPLSPPRHRGMRRHVSSYGKGILPDKVLVRILQHLDLGNLMRLRRVSSHWSKLLTSSPDVLTTLNLSPHSHKVTDDLLINRICPFVGQRPRAIVINDCHHIGDEGFLALISQCGAKVERLLLRSAWDISPQILLELTEKTKQLVEIDFSNVRKVSDNLLGLMFGLEARRTSYLDVPAESGIRGCFSLRKVKLSYSVSDNGFRYWASTSFPRLKTLVLADCTYLSDAAMYSLAQSAKALEELDLSFCCALSDVAIEILCQGCRGLKSLDVSFCGSAVSDNTMRHIGGSLKNLERLSVRGCVRVTGVGVEAVLNGCPQLEHLDVSQCRHLQPWLMTPRDMQFLHSKLDIRTIADGKWRVFE
ncbi:MAG: hypothetical protein Q9159_006845 [Coniocarpon cinnabarinum]